MYHTTGFDRDDIVELCALIHAACADRGNASSWPPVLGLFKSVVVTLTYLRRNHVQQEIAEYHGVSQSTISRAVTSITAALASVMVAFTPTADELSDEQLLVDGTLVPCWNWDDHDEMYSGKHRSTGLNLQVVCDLTGRLRWISDPADGCRHDSTALRVSGALDAIDPQNWIGDKGYIGLGMITPIRKPPHRDLLDWEKEFNTAINKIRWRIEQVIANIKTWRILHTDYRRPLNTFRETITAVIGLQFFKTA